MNDGNVAALVVLGVAGAALLAGIAGGLLLYKRVCSLLVVTLLQVSILGFGFTSVREYSIRQSIKRVQEQIPPRIIEVEMFGPITYSVKTIQPARGYSRTFIYYTRDELMPSISYFAVVIAITCATYFLARFRNRYHRKLRCAQRQ